MNARCKKDTIYFSFTAYFLIKEHPAVCEMLLIEFTNREAYAVISCACPLGTADAVGSSQELPES